MKKNEKNNNLKVLYEQHKNNTIKNLTEKYKQKIDKAPNSIKAIEHYRDELLEDKKENNKIIHWETTESFNYVFLSNFKDYIEVLQDFETALNIAKKDTKNRFEPDLIKDKLILFSLSDKELIIKLAETIAYEEYFDNFDKIHSKHKNCIPVKYYWEPNFNSSRKDNIDTLYYKIIETSNYLICPETKLANFKKLFKLFRKHKNKTFKPITWIGTLGELKYFVQQIQKNGFIKKPKCKYVVAAHLFSHKNYDQDPAKQIQSNNDIIENRKEIIINIINSALKGL